MMVKKVDSSDISIVFQGPPVSRGRSVLDGIKSAREIFPKAEIIFSTWEGLEEPEKYQAACDKVILSPVVGSAFRDPFSGIEDNAHRQIITTIAGIKAVSRKYSFKMRSDAVFCSDVLAQAREPLLPESPLRVVKKALIALSYGTIDPAEIPYLFHVGDLAMFGLTEDMRNYWNADVPFKNIGASFWQHLKYKLWFGQTGFRFTRTSAEQRIVLDFLRRNGQSVELPYIDYVSPSLAYHSEVALFGNFFFVETERSGMDISQGLAAGAGGKKDFFPYEEPEKLMLPLEKKGYEKKRYPAIHKSKYRQALFSSYFYKGLVALLLYWPLKSMSHITGKQLKGRRGKS